MKAQIEKFNALVKLYIETKDAKYYRMAMSINF